MVNEVDLIARVKHGVTGLIMTVGVRWWKSPFKRDNDTRKYTQNSYVKTWRGSEAFAVTEILFGKTKMPTLFILNLL